MSNDKKISQSQRERLVYIELRLKYLGEICRRDLEERFGIQSAAASRDMALYKEMAADNVDYDTSQKRYVMSDNFLDTFTTAPERVMSWLSQGIGDYEPGSVKGHIPSLTLGRLDQPDLDQIATITRAIHKEKAIQIGYRSLTSGLSSRELVPHALVDNGLRWHVRGFDRKSGEFRDFILSRIDGAVEMNEAIKDEENIQADNQWNRIVDLELAPHPINVAFAETIEHEYGMTNGSMKIPVRAAVAGYFLRKLNVDCSAMHKLKGFEYQLWLINTPTLYGVTNLSIAPGYGLE